MKLQQLEYFVTLVTYMNFGRAAQALFVTQPALSKQISQLEQDLGVKLIIRRYHHLELTSAGALLNEEANSLLRHANYVAFRLRTAECVSRRVVVGCDNIWVESRLSSATRQLAVEFPHIEVDVQCRSYRLSLRNLASGMLDVFIYRSVSVSEPNYSIQNFKTALLHTTRLCVVVPNCNSLANRSEVHFKELAGQRFVMYNCEEYPKPAEDFRKRCSQANFVPAIVSEFPCTKDILVAVQKTGAVTLLYDDISLSRYPDLVRIPLIDDVPATLYAIWNPENPNPDIEPIIRFIQAQ